MYWVSRRKALLIAAAALVVGALSYLLAVRTGLGQRAEQSVLGGSTYDTTASWLLRYVNTITAGIALVLIGALAWRCRGLARAVWGTLFAVAAVVASQLLKHELLERPAFDDFQLDNTFPSGHMTVYGVVVAGLIWAVPPRIRGVIAVGGAALLGTVAWQLLAYGWHRPSDLLGAQALVVFAFALAAATRLPWRRQTPDRTPATPGYKLFTALLTFSGFILVLGGVVLVLFAGRMDSEVMLIGGSEIALVGSSTLATRALITLAR